MRRLRKAISAAVGEVEGVESVTAPARSKTVEITGDFNARKVVEALNAAGFHARVQGAKAPKTDQN